MIAQLLLTHWDRDVMHPSHTSVEFTFFLSFLLNKRIHHCRSPDGWCQTCKHTKALPWARTLSVQQADDVGVFNGSFGQPPRGNSAAEWVNMNGRLITLNHPSRKKGPSPKEIMRHSRYLISLHQQSTGMLTESIYFVKINNPSFIF